MHISTQGTLSLKCGFVVHKPFAGKISGHRHRRACPTSSHPGSFWDEWLVGLFVSGFSSKPHALDKPNFRGVSPQLSGKVKGQPNWHMGVYCHDESVITCLTSSTLLSFSPSSCMTGQVVLHDTEPLDRIRHIMNSTFICCPQRAGLGGKPTEPQILEPSLQGGDSSVLEHAWSM